MALARGRSTRARGRLESDFTKNTLDHLRDEVGNVCSVCERPTSGPSREPGKRTNVGTGAHITAAASGGPRYNASLTVDQRRSHENGIWCCRDCGKLIDDDASTYTVPRLRQIGLDPLPWTHHERRIRWQRWQASRAARSVRGESSMRSSRPARCVWSSTKARPS